MGFLSNAFLHDLNPFKLLSLGLTIDKHIQFGVVRLLSIYFLSFCIDDPAIGQMASIEAFNGNGFLSIAGICYESIPLHYKLVFISLFTF